VQAPRDRHQDREDTRPYVSRRSGRQHKPNDNLERVPHRTLPLAVWPTGSPNPARQRHDAKTIRTQAGRRRQSRMGKGVGADELAAGQNQLEARARARRAGSVPDRDRSRWDHGPFGLRLIVTTHGLKSSLVGR
jgi:hypothetical protein